ncbi:MAG: WD40 repeat domain-containing protein, partial [Planctomycetales bacterium]|nr:WD40 repeat domain-containing protein [Planctomycetales bacterium]
KRQALKALRSSYRADLQQAYGAWGDGRVLAASELLRTIAQNVEGHLDLGCDYRLLAASVQAVHRRLAEHEAPATEIQAIPGSDWLVSAGHDGRLHFHNRLTGQLEHVAKAIEGFVIDALAVSPDGKRIAVSYTQPALGMGHAIVHGLEPNSDQSWLVNSKIIHFAPSTIESLSFSACGRFLAIGPRYSTVSLYSLEDSAVTGRVPTHGRNRCLSFSPDGKHCLVAGKEALLQVVDSATGQVEREVPCARVPHYAVWSPAGDCLAYVDYGSDTVYLCTSTGSELQRARLKQPYGTIESLAFSPDGSLLSAGTQRGGVAVWDVLPGLHVEGGEYNERYAAIVHNACVPAVCLPDNGHLLSVSESGAVLETRLEEQSFGFLEHDAIVSCTLRLPDRELMLVGEADGKVLSCTMEGETQQVLFAAHGRPVSKLCVGPQGRWVAAGWEDGRLALLDRHTGEVQECGYLPPQDSLDMRKIKDLSFSDDGELLVACGDDARLRMWKVGDSSQPLWEYRARSLAYAVCFVGAEQVALGGMFEEILLFDAHSGAALRSIDGASRTSCLLYDSHFKRLISGHDDGRIRIYDTPDFKLCATLDGDVGGILSLMISPSRECYLSGDSAGKLKVWNAEDCVPLGTLTNFQPNVRIRGIEFCPSRHTLLLHNEVQSDGGACRNGFSRIAIQPGLSQHVGSAIK